MNRQRLSEIIASPDNLDYRSDINLVKELIEGFPYFPTSYLMLSKMLHDQNSIYFDKNLKISAAYIGDREILYNYIYKASENAVAIPAEVATEPQEEIIAPAPAAVEQEAIIVEPDAATTVVDNLSTQETPVHEPVAVEPAIEPEQALERPQTPDAALPAKEFFQYAASDYLEQYYKPQATAKAQTEPELPAVIIEPVALNQSFTGWLDVLEKKGRQPKQAKETLPTQREKAETLDINALIDRFIKVEPRIKPQQAKMYNPEDMARKSVAEDTHLVTETLAQIYVKQGLKAKAVEIFRQLILKYPQKSDYFASRIREIESEGNI